MAYNTKYLFRFDSIHGVEYRIYLEEDGYSGSIIQRPLGKAPIFRMKESVPFRPTSLDLVLECRTEGEYVDLYTTDPRKYRVDVYRRINEGENEFIWRGFVATEIYSEPDIAPPYDVSITATDGLGVLKEYDFVPGPRTIVGHLSYLLGETGMNIDLWSVSALKANGGTVPAFFDNVKIDLDYMDGKSCYEVLSELLTTLRLTVTQWRGAWLLIRETDVSVASNGKVAGYDMVGYTSSMNISDMAKVVGQMGATGVDMWPVGYLTRRVVPAKKSITIRSDWHPKNGAPALADWSSSGDAHRDTHGTGSAAFWALGTGYAYTEGRVAASMSTYNFKHDIKVTVKVNGSSFSSIRPSAYIKVIAAWVSNGTTKYYSPSNGWDASSPDNDEVPVKSTNATGDPAVCETVEVTIPCSKDSNAGYFAINVIGLNVEVYDIDVQLVTNKGYEDTIIIDNGARGSAQQVNISGGRELSSDLIPANFMRGVFYTESGGVENEVTAFADNDNSNLDYLSLTALNCAKCVAVPRIEINGKLDFPSALVWVPLLIKSHGVWALMSSYDWDLRESEVSFKAVTLPTATLEVDSEEIVSY